MQKAPLIAKITRPRLTGVLGRTRLFDLLDRGRQSPVIWVNGPAGSGKTTLVASWLDARNIPCLWYHLDEGDSDIATFFYYLGIAARRAAPRYRKTLPLLTMEYLRGVSTFTKRYFEDLCARLRPPHVIVLDNYHHLAHDSLFHDMIRDALTAIPEGMTMVISSRGAPPPALALVNTYGKMQVIGWDDLKFNLQETRSLLKAEKNGSECIFAEELQRLTEGWAAGLTLLRERKGIQAGTSHELDRLRPDEFFDYFATELFQKTDARTQNVLLKTAFLPRVSAGIATELTGHTEARTLLAALSRNHFFTEQRPGPDPVYQYHPLFRAFLEARARQAFSGEEIRALLYRAAELLESAGQIEDAVELYHAAEAWNSLVRIVLANARAMTSQGRTRLLETWIRHMPPALLKEDPWLLYTMGVCRMPFVLLEGRRYFEQSFDLFKTRNDVSGVYLAWSGVAESIIQELGDLTQLDPWIAALDTLMKEYPVFPSPQTEWYVTAPIFMALSLRQPWHPAFHAWKDKAMALLDGHAEASLRMLCGFYLLSHFIQIGDPASCDRVISTMRAVINSDKQISPLAYTMGKTAEAWMAFVTYSYERCLTMMQEGLDMSKRSGVHLWDYMLKTQGVIAGLMSGDLRHSEQLLSEMSPVLDGGRPLDRFYYYHLTSWYYLQRHDLTRAVSSEKAALDLVTAIGFPGAAAKSRFLMAHLLGMNGQYRQARQQIAECRRMGRKWRSGIYEFTALLSEASIAFAEHHEAEGLRLLSKGMKLGREDGYAAFSFTLLPKQELSYLCMRALEAGIEPDFVIEMIRRRKLMTEEPPLHIERWPWPIRIYTLGRFEIVRDGKPLHFAGKVQKRPLDMLQVLIANGGRDVSEGRITDSLWPDADGDTARLSFKSTLHRLRQLLGNDAFIQMKEGRLSIDRYSCWVDAWAFEAAAERAAALRPGQAMARRKSGDCSQEDKKQSLLLLEKALALYRGHYLGDEGDRPWATSFREKMRQRFMHIVSLLGDYWIKQHGPRSGSAIEKAVECYLRGLEIDDVAEEFYQRLMICYGKLGRKSEAARIFRRCKNTLASSLGLEPSEETRGLYRKTTSS